MEIVVKQSAMNAAGWVVQSWVSRSCGDQVSFSRKISPIKSSSDHVWVRPVFKAHPTDVLTCSEQSWKHLPWVDNARLRAVLLLSATLCLDIERLLRMLFPRALKALRKYKTCTNSERYFLLSFAYSGYAHNHDESTFDSRSISNYFKILLKSIKKCLLKPHWPGKKKTSLGRTDGVVSAKVGGSTSCNVFIWNQHISF